MSDVLVVRASGAQAALAALGAGQSAADNVQLIMAAPLSRRVRDDSADFPGCTVEIRPVGVEDIDARAVAVLTIAASRLTIDVAELRPLMFQPVPVQRPIAALFGSAVAQLLAVNDVLDQHGVTHYLAGLAELVLRSALRSQLNQAGNAARRREAIEYVTRHLADPDLTADRVADALFLSRRRLYQLFDDGDGISGRIRRLRIERAKDLLADPTRARTGIGDVARQCGFVNSAHFSRTFRKIVGRTPGEFRSGVEVDRRDQASENR